MNTEPNDGAFRLYGLHVHNISHNISHSWLEIHYAALNEEGQLILPSGDNFDDWAFNGQKYQPRRWASRSIVGCGRLQRSFVSVAVCILAPAPSK